MPVNVLFALDPPELARRLKRRVRQSNVSVVAPDADVAAALRLEPTDLAVVSSGLLPAATGEWVREVRGLPEGPEVVLVHDEEAPPFRAAMIRAGCLAVLNAGLPVDELAETLQALIQRRQDHVRLLARAASPADPGGLDDFIARSPRMRDFLAMARRFVDADSSLLLLGETGSGKERLARAIHAEGPRAGGPFLAVNCGGLPETLLESELFGHERGAFTGAVHARKGCFERADGGTLFLDEIGEVPLHLQVKLLRAIEQRQVQRLGGERSLSVAIRVMAASNRDLEHEVEAGRFRRDLYYRLAVVTLTLPPLRERLEDIPPLFESYVEHLRVVLNRPVRGVERAAMEALVRYRWPGNVRELINVAERAVLLSAGPEIGLADLPTAISSMAPRARASRPTASGQAGAPPPWLDKPLRLARREASEAFEHAYLTHLLRSTGGRIGESARRAGINERSLYELMRRHELRKEDFRAD